MIVANRVQYNPIYQFTSRLSLYENVDNSIGGFQLVDSNWLNIPALQLKSVHPSFGDIDGDGDQDLLLGDQDGFIRVFENDNGFQTVPTQLTDNTSSIIDVGQFSTPQLFDLNRDGLLDLMVGEKEGNINYYKNIGTTTAASFQFIEDTLANIVAPNYLGIYGYSVPHFLDVAGMTVLFLGTETGVVQYYTLDALASDEFAASLPNENMIKREGDRSSVAFTDFNNDGFLDLVMGQVGGGLAFFLDIWENVEEVEVSNSLQAFPNPSSTGWNLLIENLDSKGEITLFDVNGRVVEKKGVSQKLTVIDNQSLPNGIYMARYTDDHFSATVRLIKQ